MQITWDEPKRLSNVDKHALDFIDLNLKFFETARIFAVRQGRSKALGQFTDRTIAVVFAPLGKEAISVISMRPASAAERKLL